MPLGCQPAAVQLGPEGQARSGEGPFGHGCNRYSASPMSHVPCPSVLHSCPDAAPPLCPLPCARPQAFLGVLQLLQKGNPLSLVQQYGELYRLLAADGYSSWLDYLLDQASGFYCALPQCARSSERVKAACCQQGSAAPCFVSTGRPRASCMHLASWLAGARAASNLPRLTTVPPARSTTLARRPSR